MNEEVRAMGEPRVLAAFSAFCCGLSMTLGSELFPMIFGVMAAFALGVGREPSET
jgi:hypothetical protein